MSSYGAAAAATPEVEKPLAAQVYDGLVYLDGVHERIDADVLDHAYVAWCPRVSVNSEGFRRDLDRRYRTGDKHTISVACNETSGDVKLPSYQLSAIQVR